MAHKPGSNPQMIFPRTWDAFRKVGLLWWVNRMLHLFGWAIVVDTNEDGKATHAYPARVRFRGFSDESETAGFKALASHLSEEGIRLVAQANEDFVHDGLGWERPVTGQSVRIIYRNERIFRVCDKCHKEIWHIEDCPDCFGFGRFKADHTPILAGQAILNPVALAGVPESCPTCDSDIRGVREYDTTVVVEKEAAE